MGQVESKAGQGESKAGGEFVYVSEGPASSATAATAAAGEQFRSPVLDRLASLHKQVPLLQSGGGVNGGVNGGVRRFGQHSPYTPSGSVARESVGSTPTPPSSQHFRHDDGATPTTPHHHYEQQQQQQQQHREINGPPAASMASLRLTTPVGASVDAYVHWGRCNAAEISRAQDQIHTRIDRAAGPRTIPRFQL